MSIKATQANGSFYYFLLFLLFYHQIIIMAPVPSTAGGTGLITVPSAYSLVSGGGQAPSAFNFLSASTSIIGQAAVSAGTNLPPVWQYILPGTTSGTCIAAGVSTAPSAYPARTTLCSPTTYPTLNSAAVDNTAFGYQALRGLTTGTNNTSVGAGSLPLITTSSNMTAFGRFTFNLNTSITACVGIGDGVGSVTGGAMSTSVCIGSSSGLRTLLSNSTCIGYATASSITSATSDLTAIGQVALLTTASGSSGSVAVGFTASQNGSPIRTTCMGTNSLLSGSGSNHVAFGLSTGGTLLAGTTNNLLIGANVLNVTSSTSNQIVIGNSSTTAAYIYGAFGVTVLLGSSVLVNASSVLGTTTSSMRHKKNIQDVDPKEILEKIMRLNPISFCYNNETEPIIHYGLIAQELHAIFPELITYSLKGKITGIQYHKLTPLLIAAQQALNKKIKKLEEKINHLKTLINDE